MVYLKAHKERRDCDVKLDQARTEQLRHVAEDVMKTKNERKCNIKHICSVSRINHDDIRDNMLAVILSRKKRRRRKKKNALMYAPFSETIICTRYCICFRGTPVISLKKDV